MVYTTGVFMSSIYDAANGLGKGAVHPKTVPVKISTASRRQGSVI
jgi:hypothetical protein